MKINHTKAKLAEGGTAYGLFLRYAAPGLAEFLSYLGWDFLVFDAEHSSMSPADCEAMARAIEPQGVTAMARVPSSVRHELLKFMDTGLGGVQVPWVETPEQAEAAVRAIKYQPMGERGLAGTRAADYGQGEPLAEYIQTANRESLVALQIESGKGVQAASEICSTDGVDVIFIGPTDLSNSLGVTGQMDHPDLLAAIDTIAQAASDNGKVLGAYVNSADAARTWKKRGARYLTLTTEALLAPASKNYLNTLREEGSGA